MIEQITEVQHLIPDVDSENTSELKASCQNNGMDCSQYQIVVTAMPPVEKPFPGKAIVYNQLLGKLCMRTGRSN